MSAVPARRCGSLGRARSCFLSGWGRAASALLAAEPTGVGRTPPSPSPAEPTLAAPHGQHGVCAAMRSTRSAALTQLVGGLDEEVVEHPRGGGEGADGVGEHIE